jgi:hypothetical protein
MIKIKAKIKVPDSNGEEQIITGKDIESIDVAFGEIYKIYYEDQHEVSTSAYKDSFEILEFSLEITKETAKE